MALLGQMINNYYRMSIKAFILIYILFAFIRVNAGPCNATHLYALSTTCYLCTFYIIKNAHGYRLNITLIPPHIHAKQRVHQLILHLLEIEAVYKVNYLLFSMPEHAKHDLLRSY